MTGRIVSIHIATAAEAPTRPVREAHAVAGRGLEGDRYCIETGTYSRKPGPDRELTLIEEEALAALGRDHNVTLSGDEARRNLVTRGVALNHLVGREFLIGEVRARGIRLCEPCDHLAKLTGKNVVAGLVHRGGLRAQVLTSGMIRVGDPVQGDSEPSEAASEGLLSD